MSLLKANEKSLLRSPRAYPPLWTVLVIPLLLILAGCTLPVGPEQMPAGATTSPAPVIAVAPLNGQPGTVISVASAGWQPRDVIYINIEAVQAGKTISTTIGVATADNDGRVTTSFVLPPDAAKSDSPEIQVVAYSSTTGETTSTAFTLGTGTIITGTVTATLTQTVTPTVTPATPTPTLTPTAGATATATPLAGFTNVAHILLQGLNLRAGPGVGYAIIDNLTKGSEVTVLGQSVNAYWLNIQLSDGSEGWVARPYTDFKEMVQTIPVAQPTYAPGPTATPTPLYASTPATIVNWRGEYFNNRSLVSSPVLVRDDPTIDFDWGNGSPVAGVPSDNFAARWTRGQYFDAGTYRFHLLVDDGAYLFVDNNLLINEWHDGAVRETTADIYLGQGTHNLRVEYYENTGVARIKVWWEQITPSSGDSFPDWKGEYWTNRRLDGDPELTRNDDEINFNWGNGSPDDRIPDDGFSVRWTRTVDFRRGLYRLYARADDGIRVWVDDDRVIDEWHDGNYGDTYTVDLNLDNDTDLRVEYYERNGGARVKFWWDRISDEATATAVAPKNPSAKLNPSSGSAGASVTVSGGGFPANTAVYVYLGATVRASSADAAPQRYANGVTDNRGNYTIAFTLPTTWPDGKPLAAGQLIVMVATDNFSVQASDTFNLKTPQPTVAGQPYVNVNPSRGGLDSAVTVSGGGFPGNTRVGIYLAEVAAAAVDGSNPHRYASGTTDNNGNFSINWTIPHRWDNGDPIETGKLVIVVATDNFSKQASGTFDYFIGTVPNPSINLNPGSGGPGTPVVVSGSGFPANIPVYANLGVFGEQIGAGNAQLCASTTTDRNGNYSMSFALPATWANGKPITDDKLIILVATQDFSVKVSAVFNFAPPPTPTGTLTPTPIPTPTPASTTVQANPAVNLSTGSGGPGTQVGVSGVGFPANTTVNVHLAGFDGDVNKYGPAVRYVTAATDANGNYNMSFAMPADWPNGDSIDSGKLLVIVATNDFRVQASAVFDYRESAAAGNESTPAVAPSDTPTGAEVDTPTAIPATAAPADTATPTAVATDTPTPAALSTDTPTAVVADTATAATTDIPTDTPTAAPPTVEPTATPVATETPTSAPVEKPTKTPKPTKEPTATRTPKPEPTNTPLPPTDTATPAPPPTEAPTAAPPPTDVPTVAPPAAPITDTVTVTK